MGTLADDSYEKTHKALQRDSAADRNRWTRSLGSVSHSSSVRWPREADSWSIDTIWPGSTLFMCSPTRLQPLVLMATGSSRRVQMSTQLLKGLLELNGKVFLAVDMDLTKL